jgi:signal transduction histidine kinase
MTRRRAVAAGIALALAAVTAGVAVADAAAAALLTYAYLVPVVMAACRSGLAGGLASAVGALLLAAPWVLPDIEWMGISAPTAHTLVTFALLLGAGVTVGALADQARAQQARCELALGVPRLLGGDAALETALGRLRAWLERRLGASGVALVVREGDGVIVAGGDGVAPGSVVARVLDTGAAVYVPDAGAGGGLRRAFVAPLVAGEGVIGALAVERAGDLGAGVRATLLTLGVQIGLGLENARLASRQRRFADELEAKVASATRRLEEADRAKSTFVAIASHELRTPLTAILGFSELLATRRFPELEVRRCAELMHTETERLVRIVDDFLDLSRLERGLPPRLAPVALAVPPALAAAAELFRRGTPTHDLHVDCPPVLPRIDADPDALDRVLKNLISNALKYAPAGSAVWVRARPVIAGVEIVVEDAGAGISPAALPHVFEPYYRAPDAPARARGAGLGLAVVKALVDAHGGRITIDSAPGGGTRVCMVFPRAVS